MEHTAGPWRTESDAKSDEFFWIVSGSETEIAMVADGRIDDARRICACVNACDGLDTELLESIVSLGGTLPRRLEAMTNWERSIAEKQRDELLAALMEMEAAFGVDGHGGQYEDGECPVIDRARSAIAKVGGGTTATEGHNV